jgi:hypothetical protein
MRIFRERVVRFLRWSLLRVELNPTEAELQASGREAVRRYLTVITRTPQVMELTHEAAILRAQSAASFVEHPYWTVMSRMLTGTIQAETEEMLAGDTRLAVNRASVAICRKVMQMPYFDIEQGKAAAAVYASASKAATADRTPWLREVKS